MRLRLLAILLSVLGLSIYANAALAAAHPRPSVSHSGVYKIPFNINGAAHCDQDGPCLHTTSASAGTPVGMFMFQSNDPFEYSSTFFYGGDYGCTTVSAATGCPFQGSHANLNTSFNGDAMVEFDLNNLSGSPCEAAYPGNVLHVENCNTAPDRDVFVIVPVGGGYDALVSPYWTNAGNCGSASCTLYGPPVGQNASVNTYTDDTRQHWTDRA